MTRREGRDISKKKKRNRGGRQATADSVIGGSVKAFQLSNVGNVKK